MKEADYVYNSSNASTQRTSNNHRYNRRVNSATSLMSKDVNKTDDEPVLKKDFEQNIQRVSSNTELFKPKVSNNIIVNNLENIASNMSRVNRTKSCTPTAQRSFMLSTVAESQLATTHSQVSAKDKDKNKNFRKKWNTAFRVVQSITRFKNIPTRFTLQFDQDNVQLYNEEEIDPIYLALKQATGKYGSGCNMTGISRRDSSVTTNFSHVFERENSCTSPSPKNLSQVSLQDSGYTEASGSGNNFFALQLNDGLMSGFNNTKRHGSYNGESCNVSSSGTIQNAFLSGINGKSNRCPKLSKQMKSLSLDCAEMLPLPNINKNKINHIVIHEYITQTPEDSIYLGDRLHILDNGDPDWLHGFKINDRFEHLITFPSTCVAPLLNGEQPMKLLQNVYIAENKLRLYRDQVVFAQPNFIESNIKTIIVRNEHNKHAPCPIQYLTIL